MTNQQESCERRERISIQVLASLANQNYAADTAARLAVEYADALILLLDSNTKKVSKGWIVWDDESFYPILDKIKWNAIHESNTVIPFDSLEEAQEAREFSKFKEISRVRRWPLDTSENKK